MLVRLAFSVMIQVDADILLIDEVLAVGDAAFQQKCFDEFARIRAAGTTVLLVTHDMGAVQRFCDRALLLEHGRVVELGEPERVGDALPRAQLLRGGTGARGRRRGDSKRQAPTPPEAEPMRLGDGARRDRRGAGSRTSTARAPRSSRAASRAASPRASASTRTSRIRSSA